MLLLFVQAVGILLMLQWDSEMLLNVLSGWVINHYPVLEPYFAGQIVWRTLN